MDEAAKKSVLRLFTYGLYVVTSQHGDRRDAFTANWLTQVSFTPPLLALSIENDAASLELIRGSGRFTVCVLESGRRELAGALGRPLRRAADKLDDLAWLPVEPDDETPTETPPAIADCLGYVHCAVRSETPAGDSTLLLARVYGARMVHTGESLTMREAGFRHSG